MDWTLPLLIQSNITTAPELLSSAPLRSPESRSPRFPWCMVFNRRAHGSESGSLDGAWRPGGRDCGDPAVEGAELPDAVHGSRSPWSRSPPGRAPGLRWCIPEGTAIEYRKKSRLRVPLCPAATVHHGCHAQVAALYSIRVPTGATRQSPGAWPVHDRGTAPRTRFPEAALY